MITIEKYDASRSEEWNRLVHQSPNGLFLFDRNYMDYHSDRFTDHSLLFIENDQLIALLPANLDPTGNLISYEALTFGSLIKTPKLRSAKVLEITSLLVEYVKEHAFASLVYKPIPAVFQTQASDDDLYALHCLGLTLFRRDLSSVVHLNQPHKYSKGRKWSIGKAKKAGVTIQFENQLAPFYEMLENRLEEKYSVKPVHSKDELGPLASRFPDNIKISCAYLEDSPEPCAGVTLYDYGYTLHTQYMATTEEGRDIGALDFLIDHHITEAKQNGKNYFSFGTSTVEQGTVLKTSLVQQKESFGARSITHDFYKLEP
jgi:hypothetical protein